MSSQAKSGFEEVFGVGSAASYTNFSGKSSEPAGNVDRMEALVSDPEKRGEGINSYTIYRVTTTVYSLEN